MSAADLGPDEKLCPYCAEVIKAAAVKCRYCHSDLPSDVEPRPDLEPVATPYVDWDSVAPPTATPPVVPPRPPLLQRGVDKVVVGLLVLCLVLGGALAAIIVTSGPDDLAKAGNGQVTDAAYRTAAMSAAAANATTMLSYSYRTFEADQKATRAVTTGKARKEYDEAIAEVEKNVNDAKLVLKATVMSVSLISLTERTAKALLFVNQVTTAAGSTKQQLDQTRVILTLTRKDGDWIVSHLNPV